ncbi:hypothetical protein KNE206_77780 [Kitasatospora sp. NE20-6]|uniref:hypothetical protein n=1 Tax=Kitasatospora sp. NE20-6 TaxID=2859066 RepID=UPI0034DBEA88
MRTVRVAPGVRQTVRPVVTAIAAGLLVTGCSAGPVNGAVHVMSTPPAIAATPTAPATGYGGLTGLPLSAYGTSEQDDVLLYRTNAALVARCMKNLGSASQAGRQKIQATTKTQEDKEAIHPAGAWGYIGSATAKRIGFHVAVPLPATRSPTGQALKDYNACWDEADKQLPSLAGTKGWKLTQDLFGQSLQQVAADSRVGAARERWSACMGAMGHPADAPEKVAGGPWDTEKPTSEEIAAATANESCTQSSGLAAVYFAVLTGYQQQLISANVEVLAGYRKQVRDRVDLAARLLAGLPAT